MWRPPILFLLLSVCFQITCLTYFSCFFIPPYSWSPHPPPYSYQEPVLTYLLIIDHPWILPHTLSTFTLVSTIVSVLRFLFNPPIAYSVLLFNIKLLHYSIICIFFYNFNKLDSFLHKSFKKFYWFRNEVSIITVELYGKILYYVWWYHWNFFFTIRIALLLLHVR